MLKRENTVLRAPMGKDLNSLMKLRNDVETQLNLMAFPRGNSLSRVEKWISNLLEDDKTLFFVIAEAKSDEVCGFIQVRDIHFINGVGELGICLLPEVQGRKHGQNAMILLESFANDIFKLRKIILRVIAGSRAIEFYKKAGFRQVGIFRKHHYLKGTFKDVVLMEKMIGK